MAVPLRVNQLCENWVRSSLGEVRIVEEAIASKGFAIRAVDAARCREADKVEKYDAVFFTEQHSDVVQLTEAVLSRGASAVLLNKATCSPRANELIVSLCRDNHAALVTVGSYSSLFDLRNYFLSEISRYEKKRRRLTLELQRILMNLTSPERCRTVFERYGDFTGSEYCVLVFFIGSDSEGELPDSDTLSRIERCAEIGASETVEGAQTVSLGGDVALLLEGQTEMALSAAQLALSAVPAELLRRFPIYVGIGRQGIGAEGVRRSFLTAYRTAGIQAVRGQPGSVLSYEMLGISKMLMELDGNAECVARFSREILQPLLDNDKRTGDNLVGFLRLYFELDGSKKKVSEAACMHRNTVNYQFNRISGILHRDVLGLQTLAEIAVALKYHEMSLGDDVK